MKTIIRSSFALLLVATLLGSLAACTSSPTAWHRPELEYFKAVNRVGPPRDPQLLFLLMGQYANANMQLAGVEYFSTRLKEFELHLSGRQKSLYLAAIGLLRAGHANKVFFLKRIGWVRDTIDILERAKRLSEGQVFVVRWISGVVYAQLPGFFNQSNAAIADLTWCLENANKAPHAGWLREVYYQLANLHRIEGHTAKAQDFLQLSGYVDFDKPVTFTTPFCRGARDGAYVFSKTHHRDRPRQGVRIVRL